MKPKILLSSLSLLLGMYASAQWSLTGNASTSPGTNFIGTTDGQALVIKTDNTERIRVTDAGSVIFKSALGSTGTEKIFTIKGGLSSIGEVDLFEMSSSGSWRIGGASGANALVYNSVNALLSSGSGTDVDFTPSGQLLVNNVSATRLRGKNWWQTHVELDGPSIEYRAYAGTYVGAGQSAHKFTTYTPLTDNGSFLASFDNGGSSYMVITKGGNIGIGTASPSAKLHVSGGESRFSAEEDNIGITNTAGTQNIGTIGRNTGDASLQVQAHYANLNLAAGSSAGHINLVTYNSGKNITLMPTGSVGVNTTSPNSDAKLDVNGNIFTSGKIAVGTTTPASSSSVKIDVANKIGMGSHDLISTGGALLFGSNWGGVGNPGAFIAGEQVGSLGNKMLFYARSSDGSNTANDMTITGDNANVGIGTATPNSNAQLDVSGNIFTSGKIAVGTTDMTKISDYSLVVNGEALFTKARVKLYSNWPDYVFEDKYGLLPIAQLEQYIKTNKHLPGIPSAAEVAKEGIDLGGNQAQLLQKIEELTLYIIDQNKKIETLQKENAEVRQKLNLPVTNQ